MESNALDILNQTQPFAALTVQDRRDLAPEMIRKRFPKGEILAVQNKTVVEHVLVIVSGTLELFFEENGQRTISGELHAGDIFGGISLLMNAGLAVRTVQAKTDTLAFVMLKKDFLSLCTRQPNVAKFFVDEFSHRMLERILRGADGRHPGSQVSDRDRPLFLSPRERDREGRRQARYRAPAQEQGALHPGKIAGGRPLHRPEGGGRALFRGKEQKNAERADGGRGPFRRHLHAAQRRLLGAHLEDHRAHHLLHPAQRGFPGSLQPLRGLFGVFHRHLRQTHVGPLLRQSHFQQPTAAGGGRPLLQPAGGQHLQSAPDHLPRGDQHSAGGRGDEQPSLQLDFHHPRRGGVCGRGHRQRSAAQGDRRRLRYREARVRHHDPPAENRSPPRR